MWDEGTRVEGTEGSREEDHGMWDEGRGDGGMRGCRVREGRMVGGMMGEIRVAYR